MIFQQTFHECYLYKSLQHRYNNKNVIHDLLCKLSVLHFWLQLKFWIGSFIYPAIESQDTIIIVATITNIIGPMNFSFFSYCLPAYSILHLHFLNLILVKELYSHFTIALSLYISENPIILRVDVIFSSFWLKNSAHFASTLPVGVLSFTLIKLIKTSCFGMSKS